MTGAAGAPYDIAARIADAVQALPPSDGRRLVAVAGPPASGKSTVAALARAELEARGIPAGLLAMDGFHLDNRILIDRGLLPRKGAPETFDAAGFRAMLRRLGEEDEIAVPEFDRALDVAIAARAIIGAGQRVVVVEGNYLLLDEPGWSDCARFWALSVFLDAPLDLLEERLIQRWLDHGLEREAAIARARSNDMPNARRILENSRGADIVLGPGAPAP
jgi:fructokinase